MQGWDLLGNLNLTGVCVKNCPGYGEIICTDYYHAVKRGEMPNVTEVSTATRVRRSYAYVLDMASTLSAVVRTGKKRE